MDPKEIKDLIYNKILSQAREFYHHCQGHQLKSAEKTFPLGITIFGMQIEITLKFKR